MDDEVPVKVYVYWQDDMDPEVRRFGMDRNSISSFKSIDAKIQYTFPRLKEMVYSINWRDEEDDDILIGNDEELSVMLTAQSSQLLKLFVYILCNDKNLYAGNGTVDPMNVGVSQFPREAFRVYAQLQAKAQAHGQAKTHAEAQAIAHALVQAHSEAHARAIEKHTPGLGQHATYQSWYPQAQNAYVDPATGAVAYPQQSTTCAKQVPANAGLPGGPAATVGFRSNLTSGYQANIADGSRANATSASQLYPTNVLQPMSANASQPILATGSQANIVSGPRVNAASGSQPFSANGYQANVTSGSQPFSASGYQANVSSGSQPFSASGYQANVASGSQPFSASGYQANVASGSQPFSASGYQANVASGSQPFSASGYQANVGSGYQANVASGSQPFSASGFQALATSSVSQGNNSVCSGRPSVACTNCHAILYAFQYRCLECDNYDLCSDCASRGLHPEHCMVRISYLQRPMKMVKESSNSVVVLFKPKPEGGIASGPVASAMQKAPSKHEAKQAAKERREEKREEKRQEKVEKRLERMEKRQERKDERRERRKTPAKWSHAFAEFVEQFANLAANPKTDDKEMAKLMNTSMHLHDVAEFEDLEREIEAAQNSFDDSANAPPPATSAAQAKTTPEAIFAQNLSTSEASLPKEAQTPITAEASNTRAPILQQNEPELKKPEEQDDSGSGEEATSAYDEKSRDASPDKSTEEWTMISKENDSVAAEGTTLLDTELPEEFQTRAGPSHQKVYPPLNAATAVHDLKETEAPEATAVPPTKTEAPPTNSGAPATGTGAPKTGTGGPNTETGAPKTGAGGANTGMGAPRTWTGGPNTGIGASPWPQTHSIGKYPKWSDPQDPHYAAADFNPFPGQSCARQPPPAHCHKPCQAVPTAPFQYREPPPAHCHKPCPAVPTAPCQYHHIPHVDAAVRQMLAMGFKNDDGWLTKLLAKKDGNIAEVLDLLTTTTVMK